MYITGMKVDRVRTSSEGPEFELGTRGAVKVAGTGTREYLYVQDSGAGITGAGYVVLVSAANVAIMASTTTSAPAAGAGKPVGVAAAAIAASGYGWVQIAGPCAAIRVSASAAAYTLLNTTATAGQLDDDATAGAEVINGLALNAANGGAAGTVAGVLNYPDVGRTL